MFCPNANTDGRTEITDSKFTREFTEIKNEFWTEKSFKNENANTPVIQNSNQGLK